MKRVFVEKKPGCDVGVRKLCDDIKNVLKIEAKLRKFVRYDVEGLTDDDFARALVTVFSEPPVDAVYREELPKGDYTLFGVEYLPGQYDQRADSAAQCVQLLTLKEKPLVRCADIYAVSGVSEAGLTAIKKYLINPVDSRESSLYKPLSLKEEYSEPPPPRRVDGFGRFDESRLAALHREGGFAMSLDDLAFVRDYFRGEGRDPYETELKVIDTYWSDHCRHTTFNTEFSDVEADDELLRASYDRYKALFDRLYEGRIDKYPCLMDVATIGARALKERNGLPMLDESEEINACSIKIKADVDGKKEDWLVMFKNETHNHPTEIEPFGGAATCLGGAIRDPLSGRAYVYQAMRITGAGDVKAPLNDTMAGKLPQRVISRTAAAGFSSYGNQIGLATGLVREYYHPGYAAKRLEIGFVVGAAPAENVVRERPDIGDLIFLIGGATGRDGCGGATGSSKAHSAQSLETCGAEVQKGNPATERKLQRLFRNPEFSRLVKRCNDFGAGGVSVAVGELADGLEINLDAVPLKYAGLSATELAISESQERMAVVVAAKNATRLAELCTAENLDAALVAAVTGGGRMVMRRGGVNVVDIGREFLNTNGVRQSARVRLEGGRREGLTALSGAEKELFARGKLRELTLSLLGDYNVCSQKGLGEMFDSTIGAATVLMPFGGSRQLTPAVAMAAKLPVNGKTSTVTVAACGFDPYLTEADCYSGGVYAVTAATLKAVAAGADIGTVHLSMQEFFEKLRDDPVRWGKPLAALLGALDAQLGLDVPAIGGKDSMSGSFENLDVPPTVVCFALGVSDGGRVVSNSPFGPADVYRIALRRDERGQPDFGWLRRLLIAFSDKTAAGEIQFASVAERGGAVAALIKSALGSGLGVEFFDSGEDMFVPSCDLLFVGNNRGLTEFSPRLTARFTEGGDFILNGDVLTGGEARTAFEGTFNEIYPVTAAREGKASNADFNGKAVIRKSSVKTPKPRVLIPVFPGTNCEYDTARSFKAAGAETDIFVLRNRCPAELSQSIDELVRRLKKANILAFPGGFSGGDEPDGSGKFIAATFFNPSLSDAVNELLEVRDGLVLGICNGFQALIKLGLLPYGKIAPLGGDSPTLTFNNISRHVSTLVSVRVTSRLSPWLYGAETGRLYKTAVSHGEGRLAADESHVKRLLASGQIATQYAGADGRATMLSPDNPNGSVMAIEGLTSPDGRVFGKMGHSERVGEDLMKNVPGTSDMRIFESGVGYFK